MVRTQDDARIEALRERLDKPSKAAVVRAGLELLEQEAERIERARRWRRATRLAAGESRRINKEFRPRTRLGRA